MARPTRRTAARQNVLMDDVILVAVNDSPAGFAAGQVAIEYARRLGARLHAVTVVETGRDLAADADAVGRAERRQQGAEAVLNRVTALGAGVGVEVEVNRRSGAVAAEILDEARSIDAGLIVMALVDRPSHVMAYIGSQTLRVMKFATVPVLVVPVLPGR